MPFDLADGDARRALYTTVQTRFLRAFAQSERELWYQKLSTVVPANSKRVEMPFVISASGMREWIGDRIVRQIETGSWSFLVKDFERTIGIKTTDLDDDLLGAYMPEIDGMGQAAAELPDRLAADVLINGESAAHPCYDGKALFATDHPINAISGGTTFSNLYTSRALTPTNFEYGMEQMRLQKGPDGKTLRTRGRVLAVGPQREGIARRILENQMVVETAGDGATDNINRGRARLEVIDELDEVDSGTSWFLMDDSRPIRPIILARRQAPRMVRQDRDEDDAVFSRRQLTYGVDCRWAAAPGMPQCILKFKP